MKFVHHIYTNKIFFVTNSKLANVFTVYSAVHIMSMHIEVP